MEQSEKDFYFKKPLEVSKKFPHHLKLEKSEFEKFSNFFNGKEEKVVNVDTPSDNTNNEKSMETPNETGTENKNIRLRGRRKDNKKENEKIKKKYEEIPIIVHKSEKPSMIIEEMNAGKIYPSRYTFGINEKNKDKKDKCISNKKKYIDIPIVAHESEKPSRVTEEIHAGKLYSSLSNIKSIPKGKEKPKYNKKKYIDIPIVAHESQEPTLIIEEINSGRIYPYTWNLDINKKTIERTKEKAKCNKKKYIDIPIVAHESQEPTLIIEEINSGRIYPYTWNLDINKKTIEKTKEKAKYNKKKYIDIPIVAHESELPSLIIEESNSGRIYPYTWCKKKENFNKIPIIAHESEKPSFVFEERDAGKLHSTIQTSLTNYKDNKPKITKLKGGKKNLGKYKDIPIISHESEKPSIAFEEINAGNKYKNIQTSITEYKEDKIPKKLKCDKKPDKKSNKKYEKIDIVVHESEKPSFVFEQINSGKFYSNVETSKTDYCKIKRLRDNEKAEKKPIVAHKSEKPSFVFEEANTGIFLDFHHEI